ncbi:GTPBP2 isoform 6, partial [Pan troglodytes]
GICREGDQLVVGPTDDGCFLELRVCSIQRNRSACRVLRAGQAATLALGDFDRALLRKGMVMVSPEMNPTICSVFEAEIVLLFHATTFRRGFQVTVHVGNVRQTAVVEKIHAKVRGTWPSISPEVRKEGGLPQTGRELLDPTMGIKPHLGWVAA